MATTCGAGTATVPEYLSAPLVFSVARWVPLVEQEQLPYQEYLSTPLVFSVVRVVQSLVFLCGVL